jgi:hypothetical protein
MQIFLVALLSLSALAGGCKTPEGPRIPLPSQDISVGASAGKTRIVFFNSSNPALYFESGVIRIRLNGDTVPSLWLRKYVQVVVDPGEYELLLEHYDLFSFTDTYSLSLPPGDVFLEVYCSPISTKFKRHESIPPEFARRYTPGRDPVKWNAGLDP